MTMRWIFFIFAFVVSTNAMGQSVKGCPVRVPDILKMDVLFASNLSENKISVGASAEFTLSDDGCVAIDLVPEPASITLNSLVTDSEVISHKSSSFRAYKTPLKKFVRHKIIWTYELEVASDLDIVMFTDTYKDRAGLENFIPAGFFGDRYDLTITADFTYESKAVALYTTGKNDVLGFNHWVINYKNIAARNVFIHFVEESRVRQKSLLHGGSNLIFYNDVNDPVDLNFISNFEQQIIAIKQTVNYYNSSDLLIYVGSSQNEEFKNVEAVGGFIRISKYANDWQILAALAKEFFLKSGLWTYQSEPFLDSYALFIVGQRSAPRTIASVFDLGHLFKNPFTRAYPDTVAASGPGLISVMDYQLSTCGKTVEWGLYELQKSKKIILYVDLLGMLNSCGDVTNLLNDYYWGRGVK